MGLSLFRRSILLPTLMAIGAGLCPVPAQAQSPAERRASLPARKSGKLKGQDLAQERIEASRIWFGGEATPDYLDAKARLSRLELERLSSRGAKILQAVPSSAATWTNLGPKANLISPSYPDIDSGRLNAIVTHPTNPSLLYVASSTGGVFKCTNADLTSASDWTWTAITDSLPNSSSSGNIPVGAMAMSPTDPNTLYVGLGDFVDDTARGFYRSTDGGATWTEATGIGAATRTTCILPLSASVVLWGTNDGLKRSTDGGQTFTTMNAGGTGNWAWSAIAFSPTEVAIVRATLRPGYRFYFQSGAIYWSGDAGATWSQGSVTGLASFGRVALAAASDGNTGWGLAEDASTLSAMAKGLLKTTDKGHSWTFVPAPTATGGLFQGIGNQMTGDGTQAGYNHAIAVHPTNPNQVTVGANLALYRTDDGGLNWNQLTHWYSHKHVYAHADFHCTAWSLTGSPVLFVGNDGGLCIIRNPAIAAGSIPTGASSVPSDTTFIDNRRNKGLVSHQAYHIGSTGATTPSDSRDRITLGLQDNGTRVRQDTGSGMQASSTFEDQVSGDGFGTVIHPLDGNIMLGSYYYDAILKSTNGGVTGFAAATSGITESGSSTLAPFSTRLALGEADATGNTVYTFANTVVYKTVNFATSWTAMPMTGFPAGYTIRQINAAKSDPNTVAVVTTSVTGFRTTNAGGTWTQFGPIPNNGASLSYVWYDTSNAQVIYVASVALTTTNNHLWKSADGGTTWTALDGNPGFPAGIPVHVIKNDPTTPTTLLAGTDFGVYQSTNGGATWARYGQGLPMVSVRDLYIAPDASFVRVATYGRGVWELSTLAPTILAQPTPVTAAVGHTATFGVVASGSGNLAYQWKRNGAVLTGATTLSYTTPALTLADTGAAFSCDVTNSVSTTSSASATLTVQALGSLTSISSTTVTAIPDAVSASTPGAAVEVPFVISGVTGTVGEVTVSMFLTHSYVGDLVITLVAPDNSTVILSNGAGAGSGSSSNTAALGTSCGTYAVFSDLGTASIDTQASPPAIVGTFRPSFPLTAFNGKSPNGTWKLRFQDFGVADTGSFQCGILSIKPFLSGPSITLAPTTATVVQGGTQTFTPTVTNGTANTVNWSVTGGGTVPSTATASGVLQTYTAPASGTSTTVTATTVDTPAASASATVTLVAPSAVTVAVTPSTLELMVGSGTQQFTGTVSTITNTGLTWSISGGTGLGTSGLFSATGLAAGTYTVTATSQSLGSLTGTATVTLVAAASVNVAVSPAPTSVLVGATKQFSATVTGLSTGNQGVTWSVTGTGGTINATTGLFTANAAGTCTVTATNTFSGKTGTATVTVTTPPSVSLTPTVATLVLGGTQAFTPTVSNGATNTVTWTASSGTITAAATATGLAQTYTAPASGSSATVTATSVDAPPITATANVTLVAPSAVTVTVSPATAELMVGSGTQQFTSALTPLTNQSVTWSGTGVGSNGLFSASSLAAGSYTVTATSQAAATRSGTATVTLVSPSAVSVTVTAASYTTLLGATQQFSAAVTGLSAANQGVTWGTSGGGTISGTGLFTPTTVGNYTITATNAFSGKTGTATSYVRTLDLNGDGVIDLLDLLTLAKNYGSTTNVGSDLVPNGTVDDADLTFLLTFL